MCLVTWLGLPFIIAGDWQLEPRVMASSAFLDLLDATICAPVEATNVITGSVIDYFVRGRSPLGIAGPRFTTIAYSRRTVQLSWRLT